MTQPSSFTHFLWKTWGMVASSILALIDNMGLMTGSFWFLFAARRGKEEVAKSRSCTVTFWLP